MTASLYQRSLIIRVSPAAKTTSKTDWRPTQLPRCSAESEAARGTASRGRLTLRRVTPPGQVASAFRSALLGMAAAGAHLERVAGAVNPLFSLGGDRHRAFENQQTGIEFVGMLEVQRIGVHAAINHLAVALCPQLGLEFCPIHRHSPDASR